MLLRQSSAAEAPGALLARSQAVLGPLVTILENALSGETPAEVVVQVCAVLSSVAGGLKTASKAVRDTLYQVRNGNVPWCTDKDFGGVETKTDVLSLLMLSPWCRGAL